MRNVQLQAAPHATPAPATPGACARGMRCAHPPPAGRRARADGLATLITGDIMVMVNTVEQLTRSLLSNLLPSEAQTTHDTFRMGR